MDLLDLYKSLSPSRKIELANHLYESGMFPGGGGGGGGGDITLPLDLANDSQITHRTTANVAASTDKNYLTDAQVTALHTRQHSITGASDHAFPGGAGWLDADGNFTSPPGSAAVVLPCYDPPVFQWKDADEINLPAGRYHKGGYFYSGQYSDPDNLVNYWDVAALTAVDVDATYSEGAQSGMIDGAKAVSSWYYVYMTSAGICVVLPTVRVQAIAYSAPNTAINPGDHNTGLVATNTFFTANDAWNNYQLLLLGQGASAGTVYTIADTVNGTPDQILITGDKTAEIATKDWLKLMPPASVDFLELGFIRIDDSGNLLQMYHSPNREYKYTGFVSISGNKGTAAANTEVSAAVPPTARKVAGVVGLYDWIVNMHGLRCETYDGTSGANQQHVTEVWENLNRTGMTIYDYFEHNMNAISIIRNRFIYKDSSNAEQAISAGGTANLSIARIWE